MTASAGFAALVLSEPGPEALYPFVPRVSRTELPLATAMLTLAVGAACIHVIRRRTGSTRSGAVTLALSTLAAFPFAVYLAFELRFAPAFGTNRMTYGLDVRDFPVEAKVAWLAVSFLIGCVLNVFIGRRKVGPESARRATGAYLLLTSIALLLTTVGTVRLLRHPAGYLGELAKVTPREAPARHGNLCVVPVERDDAPRASAKELLDRELRLVRRGDPCPRASSNGPRVAATDTLLRDERNDVWFYPSAYHRGSRDHYVGQIEDGREIQTLGDVGAPPPYAIVGLGWISSAVAIPVAVAMARRRKRNMAFLSKDQLLLAISIVGTLAMPIVVGALMGVVL